MFFRKTYLLFTSLLMVLFSSCSDSDPVISVTSIEITPALITMIEGETYDLSVTINPNEVSGVHITWQSSDSKVATVAEGTVTAIAEGTATITVIAGSCKAECKVTVYPASWIDAEFAKVLQKNGYIKDAATVTPSEVENLTYIDVCLESLTSLKGIEYFSSLQELQCRSNKLSSLDVSKNAQLTRLWCGNNHLTTLDVSKNAQLTALSCYNNYLTTLDVSKNMQLSILYCDNNELTALDVSKNTQLIYLGCSANNLTTLDVSKDTQLTELSCDISNLTTLDVSKNTQLTKLSCYKNNLTTLDVSKNTQLGTLSCSSNNLTTLDISKNTQLTELSCYKNNLSSLDISKNTLLAEFLCYDNPGSNGQFRVKAWFDNNSVPSKITSYHFYISSWSYNGETVTLYYYQ